VGFEQFVQLPLQHRQARNAAASPPDDIGPASSRRPPLARPEGAQHRTTQATRHQLLIDAVGHPPAGSSRGAKKNAAAGAAGPATAKQPLRLNLPGPPPLIGTVRRRDRHRGATPQRAARAACFGGAGSTRTRRRPTHRGARGQGHERQWPQHHRPNRTAAGIRHSAHRTHAAASRI